MPCATVAIRTLAAMTIALWPEIPCRMAEPGMGPYVFSFMQSSHLEYSSFTHILFNQGDLVLSPDVDRRDLVDCRRLQFKDTAFSVADSPAGFNDEFSHRVRLIQEAQFSLLLSFDSGI